MIRAMQRSARGQSLVEFALVVPLLSLIVLGTIDFGRLYFSYVSVANAARVGAEYGMNPAHTVSAIQQKAVDEASPYVAISPSDVTVTVGDPDLTVAVSAQFTATTPLISSFWGGGPLTLHNVVTTRIDGL